MMTPKSSVARGRLSRKVEFARCVLAVALGVFACGPVLARQPEGQARREEPPAGSYSGRTDIDGEGSVQEARLGMGVSEAAFLSGCLTSSTVWQNTAFPAQAGVFEVELDATANANNMDGLIGLSAAAGSTYSNYAVLVGFNNSGRLQARNGGSYMAYSVIPYTAGQSYHFRLVVNVSLKRYSAYVSSGGGPEQTLALDYAFRTEQSGVTSLANWGIEADSGTHTVCGFALQPVLNVTQNRRYATIQAAIDDAANGDVIELSPMTYAGTGNRDVNFHSMAVTVRSTNPDDLAVVAATVIDCQGTEADRHRGFNLTTGEGPGAVLAGLTIRNGFAPMEQFGTESRSAGGGILVRDSSPTIRKCVITGCEARGLFGEDARGGGVCAFASGLVLEDCEITNNEATGGSFGGSGAGGGLDGTGPITIRRCRFSGNSAASADGYGDAFGGAIKCSGVVLIEDCTIDQNQAAFFSNVGGDGGGVFASGAVRLRDCRLIGNITAGSNNMGGGGGGVSADSQAVIERCLFTTNWAGDSGGGIFGSPTVRNCVIVGNTAQGSDSMSVSGGGIWGSPQVYDSLIVGNVGRTNGGGLWLMGGSIEGCTLRHNASAEGGGIYLGSGTPSVRNTIVWGNSATTNPQMSATVAATYTCIQDWTGGGQGNIAADPQFVGGPAGIWTAAGVFDVENCTSTLTCNSAAWTPNAFAGRQINPDGTQHLQFVIVSNTSQTMVVWGDASAIADAGDSFQVYDYHLRSTSACINAGDPAGTYTGRTDTDGQSRVQRGLVDIGADEWIPGDFDSNGQVDLVDADHFTACALGPMIAQADPACADANLDRDAAGDVDMIDFAIFQKCWTGTAVIVSDCAD